MTDVRQSGRTSHQLDDVIEMTVGPQEVIYLLPVERTIPYAINLLLLRLKAIDPTREYYVRKDSTVVFPDLESSVRFSWVNQFPDNLLARFRRWDSVVLDHACEEIYPKASARWLAFCELYAFPVKRPF